MRVTSPPDRGCQLGAAIRRRPKPDRLRAEFNAGKVSVVPNPQVAGDSQITERTLGRFDPP